MSKYIGKEKNIRLVIYKNVMSTKVYEDYSLELTHSEK